MKSSPDPDRLAELIRQRLEGMLSGESNDDPPPPRLSSREALEEELRYTEHGLREFRNRPGFDPALLIVLEERIEAIRRELEHDD